MLSARTPRKQKLLRETRFLKKSLAELSDKKTSCSDEDFLNYCKSAFNEDMFNFIKMQMQLSKRNPQGYRYNSEFVTLHQNSSLL